LVKVKICGLTRLEDARLAQALGAAALGFIFAAESRRFIPEGNRQWIWDFSADIPKTGVFTTQSAEEILQIVSFCNLDRVQLHSRLSFPDPGHFQVPVWQVLSPEEILSGNIPLHPAIDGYLADTSVNGKTGGTGVPFDWTRIPDFSVPKPLIIAGGLTPGNLSDLLKICKPDWIDVSSGIEESPGIKDPEKMKKLFEVVNANR